MDYMNKYSIVTYDKFYKLQYTYNYIHKIKYTMYVSIDNNIIININNYKIISFINQLFLYINNCSLFKACILDDYKDCCNTYYYYIKINDDKKNLVSKYLTYDIIYNHNNYIFFLLITKFLIKKILYKSYTIYSCNKEFNKLFYYKTLLFINVGI
jgi:hypothetical protein